MPAAPPSAPASPAPWQASRASRLAGPILFVGLFLLCMLGLATVGLPVGAPSELGVLAAASAAVGGLITPTLYLLAAFGLGRPLAALLAPRSSSRIALQLALGVAAMLWLSHAMGVLGLLSEMGPLGGASRYAAWAAVALGLLLLAHQVGMGELRPERWPVFPLGLGLWAPALGITAIAACNPAGGGLWESEFGAYDALSYHLQLAKEWAAGPSGRVWPAQHNVYSFLPSYIEAAFTHLAALSLGRGGVAVRMVGEESHWVYACQWLHLGLGLVAAILTSRLVRILAERAGIRDGIARFAGVASAALLLATPWTVVVGSLAYNELAMVAMMAGALLAAADPALGPCCRGLIAGTLVGIACSAKPTALFLVGPAVGIALLGFASEPSRLSALITSIISGSIAGLFAIGPWLLRNAIASGGNPVFPFAPTLFGFGHWTHEQADRYARAHYATESLTDRVALLAGPRGLGHEQWAYVPWMALIAGIITLTFKPTRRAAILLLLGALSQIAAWMAFTHLQSRFLLPLIVPMSAAFGLGAAAVLTTATRRLGRLRETDAPSRAAMPVLAAIVIGLLPLTAAGWSAINFARQLNTQPNRSLIMAAGGLSGMNFERSLLEAPENERLAFINESANPAAYVNLVLRSPDTQPASEDHRDLYLLGDATPLYYLDALGDTPSTATHNLPSDTRPLKVHYHTTWDSSLLGDAIASSPDDPAAWSAFMRSRGIGYILVNYSELGRLIEKDHNYDPRVTLVDVGRWVAPTNTNSTGLTSIRQWTVPIDAAGRNQVVSVELFRIGPPARSNTSESGTP